MPQDGGGRLNGHTEQVHRATLIVTNAIKLGGLILAVVDAQDGNTIEATNLLLYAFMMAGANGIETFIDRFLGNPK